MTSCPAAWEHLRTMLPGERSNPVSHPPTTMLKISRSVDYLKNLRNAVRELAGAPALAREITQNAHDAGARELVFDVGADALTIENDEEFSDCGNAEGQDCGGTPKKPVCDFHSFRILAGGAKQDEGGTIGAFGVGFSAVYQVTDQPHIISKGHHWIVDEGAPEQERISVCGDPECPACKPLRGEKRTRFILPWARSDESNLRRQLKVKAVGADIHKTFGADLRATLPHDLLFLTHPKTVRVNDHTGRWKVTREPFGTTVRVRTSDGLDETWLVLESDFAAKAEKVRLNAPGIIENKRTPKIRIAFLRGADTAGRLFAFLPTEQGTGLPFHVSADFLPTTSRKHVDLSGSSDASRWNLAALERSAEFLAEEADRVRAFLGPVGFWKLLGALSSLASSKGAASWQRAFWQRIKVVASGQPWVWTRSEAWTSARGVFLVESANTPIPQCLAKVGVELVHEDLRPFFAVLRELNVGVLDRATLVDRLLAVPLDRRLDASALPGGLVPSDIPGLRSCLASLRETLPARLDLVALGRGNDGFFWPLGRLRLASDDVLRLFGGIAGYLVESAGEVSSLERAVRPFSVRDAVDTLEAFFAARPIDGNALDAPSILAWLEGRRSEVDDLGLHRRIAALPLFATTGGRGRLIDLSLPSGFEDLIGVARLVDVKGVGIGTDFLVSLGAEPLDLVPYIKMHVVKVLRDANHLGRRPDVVHQLARYFGQFSQHDSVRSLLASSPCIRCRDGEYRQPDEVYFWSSGIESTLGDVPFVDAERDPVVNEMYRWLGVECQPRLMDVVHRLRTLAATPPTQASIASMQLIIKEIAGRVEVFAPFFGDLSEEAWLPAEGDRTRWFRGSALHASFNRDICATAATFIDLPVQVQRSCSEVLKAHKVALSPSLEVIVQHLLNLSQRNEPAPSNIYSALHDRLSEPNAVRHLNRLRGQATVYADGRYHQPSKVFWGNHPFHKRRVRLGSDLRQFQQLFDALGVRDEPEPNDCLAVLDEVAAQYLPSNSKVADEDAEVVNATLALLGTLTGPKADVVFDALRSRRVIPDGEGYLCSPELLLIGDSHRLRERFPRLARNIVPRVESVYLALLQCGARALSAAATSEVLEPVDLADDDPEMQSRLMRLRVPIARLLDAHGLALPSDWPPRMVPSSRIVARWSITMKFGTRLSDAEEVPAILTFRDGTPVLVFRQHADSSTWAPVARELSLLLAPQREPGPLAAALKEVLASGTSELATIALDEFGFPSFAERAASPDALAVSEVGVAASSTEGLDSHPPNPLPAPSAATPEPAPLLAPNSTDPVVTPGPFTNDPERRESSPTGSSPGANLPSGMSPPPPPHRRKASKDRLLSYVGHAETKSEGTGDQEEAQQARRSAVDLAAMEKVMEYELSVGRHPDPQPPTNPGYDIESRDSDSNLLRIIEVKGSDSPWGRDGVGMTPRQLEEAKRRGDVYWLYVVEQARTGDFCIHRIQNPAERITKFQFDVGWQDLEE